MSGLGSPFIEASPSRNEEEPDLDAITRKRNFCSLHPEASLVRRDFVRPPCRSQQTGSKQLHQNRENYQPSREPRSLNLKILHTLLRPYAEILNTYKEH